MEVLRRPIIFVYGQIKMRKNEKTQSDLLRAYFLLLLLLLFFCHECVCVCVCAVYVCAIFSVKTKMGNFFFGEAHATSNMTQAKIIFTHDKTINLNGMLMHLVNNIGLCLFITCYVSRIKYTKICICKFKNPTAFVFISFQCCSASSVQVNRQTQSN